ncbi:MAG: hypothetical protein HPY78_03470 [Brevinematales bacterium]|nr:hypothetical protein [Brevinematales bacterium]
MVSEKQDKYIRALADMCLSVKNTDEGLDSLCQLFFGKRYEELSIKEGSALIVILDQAKSALWRV